MVPSGASGLPIRQRSFTLQNIRVYTVHMGQRGQETPALLENVYARDPIIAHIPGSQRSHPEEAKWLFDPLRLKISF